MFSRLWIKITLPAILLLLSAANLHADGYRITLPTEKSDTSQYVLGGWRWGEKYYLDTVKAAKGEITFKGKENLDCGQYFVSDLSGRKLLETIVPRENGNFTIKYAKEGKGYSVKKGNAENRIFTMFQNFVDYGWERLETRDQFAAELASMGEMASAQCPGSITDIILGNTLFIPEKIEDIRENFPFNDTIILNTRFAEDKLEQYLKLLQYNHNDTIVKEINRLIEEAGNLELKGRIARTAYEYFYDAGIMGQEGVAVAIAQEWFLSGKLEWPNPEGKFLLQTFVEFNRHSLIGMDAPELELTDTLGDKVSLRGMEGEYTIVYFYTDDCPTCRKETPELVDFVNNYNDGTLAVYAVYANDNVERWKRYINDELNIFHPFMNWSNVYDPDFSSGFQILYNVISTPQMFLLDKEKKIIGRGLDMRSLKELLAEKNRQRDELREFISGYFEPLAGNPTAIREGIEMICRSCKDDTLLLKEFAGEMYHTLGMSDDYTLQEGAVWVAGKYILGMPHLWDASFVEKTADAIAGFNMNKLGDIAADLSLEYPDGSPIDMSDVTTEYKVLYFYRPNCGVCAQTTPELAAIFDEYREKLDINLLAINLGKGYSEWIEYIGNNGTQWENVRAADGDTSEIYRKYHLENIPTIYLLKNNVVVAKDIDTKELAETLKYIAK